MPLRHVAQELQRRVEQVPNLVEAKKQRQVQSASGVEARFKAEWLAKLLTERERRVALHAELSFLNFLQVFFSATTSDLSFLGEGRRARLRCRVISVTGRRRRKWRIQTMRKRTEAT